MTSEQIKNNLIRAGIKNLKEFGYPNVTKDNILTDLVYSQMFKSMLNDNLGIDIKFDTSINELLRQIKEIK